MKEFLIFSIFLYFYITLVYPINSQTTTPDPPDSTTVPIVCETVVTPNSYSDCKPYDRPLANSICCYVRGVYGGNNGTACIAVDELFKNKTMTITIDALSSSMFCGDLTDSTYFIIFPYFMYLFLFSILF